MEQLSVQELTWQWQQRLCQLQQSISDGGCVLQVYRNTVQPLVATLFRGGKATCFAYGQVCCFASGQVYR